MTYETTATKLFHQMKKANPDYTVHELCRVFQTSISTYYYQCRQKPIKHEELVMIAAIKTVAIEIGHCYGKRCMHASLLNWGFKLGLYRVATLLKKANDFAITQRRKHYYPNAGKTYIKAGALA